MKKIISLILLIVILIPSVPVSAQSNTMNTSDYLEELDNIVKIALNKSGTPGASVAIISDKDILLRNYGQADISSEKQVTSDTLFELGSMSKAFTALGILYLEQEGKLNLTDNIRNYIPWLTLNYNGDYKGQLYNGEVPVTIQNALYHTTGIPFKSIGLIPKGNSDDMLEKTVSTIINTELNFYPGTKYSYTTINYDILGLIIQNISGQSFESFISEKILIPLGLHETYLLREEAKSSGKLAIGYKTEFLNTVRYEAPEYRGNTPAGYVISSSSDMARWMQIQMGLIRVSDNYRQIIEKSHIGNSTVASFGDSYYASGWSVNIRGESISHGGANPNYSSMLFIDNDKSIGICVLTNNNSNAAGYITDNFFNLLYNREITDYKNDMYKSLDTVFTVIFLGTIILGIVFIVMTFIGIIDLIRKKRMREKLKGVKVAGLLLAIPIMIFYAYCIYYLPNILFDRLPWAAVNVWGSRSVLFGSIGAFTTGIIFFGYVLLTFNFPKPKEKNYITLIPLSVINGLTSALIIFTINESFNRHLEYSKELLVYFIFALAFFVYSIKLVQGRMIVITNEIAYEKRISMIDKIINSSYQTIEKVGSSRIYSGLNNDIGAVAKIPDIIIGFVSNILTLVFCLAYLLSNSLAAFIASLSVIAINGFISFLTSRVASKYWEKNRDIQDIYFGQMSDLVYGFKELVLSKLRKKDFCKDIKIYSRLSTELSKEAAVKFLNFGLYNTLMYNIIFGIVVFAFPLFIIGISVNDLRETLFMVFYLIGPFGAIMGSIPGITQVSVNLKRINKLINDLDEVSTEINKEEIIEKAFLINTQKHILLKLENITYSYVTNAEDIDNENEFTLGPIDIELKTGEITYITGGNGSGKSTLGKLITGLYSPKEGRILINNNFATISELNNSFSAVYSDFYLFKKLYGVDMDIYKDEINELLKIMNLDKKVEIDDNGIFKSLNLSTGQKKRLAYIACCLDDKPFILFDEWAAEQDPEFRQFFYLELLPKLKEKGKGVIVISHDDRYFNLADKLIKLEQGEITS